MKKKYKPTADVEHRLTKLEEGQTAMDGKLDEIKKYVSNHLVHALEQTNADLKILLNRKQNYDAVRGFLGHLLQFSVSAASLVWITIQFSHFIGGIPWKF